MVGGLGVFVAVRLGIQIRDNHRYAVKPAVAAIDLAFIHEERDVFVVGADFILTRLQGFEDLVFFQECLILSVAECVEYSAILFELCGVVAVEKIQGFDGLCGDPIGHVGAEPMGLIEGDGVCREVDFLAWFDRSIKGEGGDKGLGGVGFFFLEVGEEEFHDASLGRKWHECD